MPMTLLCLKSLGLVDVCERRQTCSLVGHEIILTKVYRLVSSNLISMRAFVQMKERGQDYDLKTWSGFKWLINVLNIFNQLKCFIWLFML